MQQYYDPSKDEKKIILEIEERLVIIAKEKFKMKNPYVRFNYNNGLHFERMHQDKEISVSLIDYEENVLIRVLISNGLLIYYKYNGEKFYVAKLKEIAKNKNRIIKKGRWIDPDFERLVKISKNKHKKKEEKEEEFVYEQPSFAISENKPKKVEENDNSFLDENFEDWMKRKAYCQQYREMFGEESILYTDEYYFF